MPIKVLMPALSPTMTEGTLAKWHKKEGDKVNNGDLLAEIETDKATMELEASDEGVLGKIIVPEGTQNVPVNGIIALLLEEGEDKSALNDLEISQEVSAPSSQEQESKKAPQPQEFFRAPEQQIPTNSDEPAYGKTTRMSIRDAIKAAMTEEMKRDENVFLIGEEVAQYNGPFKVSKGMWEEFGDERVIDTPITEYGFTGLACGAAFRGLRPIVDFMSFNFSMQAIDHIVNSAAKVHYMTAGEVKCPIVFRGPNGAAIGLAATHSQCYASWYAHIPGLIVIAPYSGADFKGLLKAAIRNDNPVVFLEKELCYGDEYDVPESEDFVLPIGKAKVERVGSDVTIVSFSHVVGLSLKAADALAKEGIEAEVINLRTLRPLDTATILESVKKTNRLVCAEEGWGFSGIGAEISSLITEQAFDFLDAPILRVHAQEVPLPYAKNLEDLAKVNEEKIINAVKKVME